MATRLEDRGDDPSRALEQWVSRPSALRRRAAARADQPRAAARSGGFRRICVINLTT